MRRSTLIAAVFGLLAAVPAGYRLTLPAWQDPAAAPAGADNAASKAVLPIEAWPICSTMGSMTETADWASLDPDFAAGKRALVAGDGYRAINAFTAAALRDSRNADIQNYLGYAYRRLRQLDPAMRHYQQALMLNPRQRSAHEHLGEAYMMQGNLAKAEEHLAALERICLIPCGEYDDLKQAIAAYRQVASR
ncbi:TPR repeat-containing protein [Bradyrhizobium lablabi]|uniref:TPR repeat-containing protein n=1 Tax=Bradyrhizobium lablabi TaxID=722472 RepID=A0A1M6S886_9BRAD|nr:tetratricopeptide repeat protein [Bradyrhizobium lablabi]SHK40871.1 TPR repeat-containing protein [Bradyrhizobium lablabi]